MDEKLLAGIAIESVSLAKVYDSDTDAVGIMFTFKVKADGPALADAGYTLNDTDFTANDAGTSFTCANIVTFAEAGGL